MPDTLQPVAIDCDCFPQKSKFSTTAAMHTPLPRWVKTRIPPERPHVSFHRVQTLVAPSCQARCFQFADGWAEARAGKQNATELFRGRIFLGGVARGDQDFRSCGPGFPPRPRAEAGEGPGCQLDRVLLCSTREGQHLAALPKFIQIVSPRLHHLDAL
jgi:hypothetical protein